MAYLVNGQPLPHILGAGIELTVADVPAAKGPLISQEAIHLEWLACKTQIYNDQLW